MLETTSAPTLAMGHVGIRILPNEAVKGYFDYPSFPDFCGPKLPPLRMDSPRAGSMGKEVPVKLAGDPKDFILPPFAVHFEPISNLKVRHVLRLRFFCFMPPQFPMALNGLREESFAELCSRCLSILCGLEFADESREYHTCHIFRYVFPPSPSFLLLLLLLRGC